MRVERTKCTSRIGLRYHGSSLVTLAHITCPHVDLTFSVASKFQTFNKVRVLRGESKPDAERLEVMKGAPERIVAWRSEVQLGNRIVPTTPEPAAEIEAQQETLSRNGLHGLAQADIYTFRHLYVFVLVFFWVAELNMSCWS